MGASEWIALIGLIMFWAATLITFWIKIRIKITELDLKIKNMDRKLDEHVTWGLNEQNKNLRKFDSLTNEMKQNYKELSTKMDVLIEKFSNFQVYCEKNFKR